MIMKSNSNGCTSKADLLSQVKPQLCDGLVDTNDNDTTTTCVVTVENYKCIEPTTTSRKLFRAGRELSGVYVTWIESGKCAFKSRTPDEEYVYQGSGKFPPNNDWKDCVQDNTENPMLQDTLFYFGRGGE